MTSNISPPLSTVPAIWMGDPLASNIAFEKDDFIAGTNTAGSIGTLGWRTVGTAVIDTINAGQGYLSCESNHPGIYHVNSTAVIGGSGGIITAGSDLRPFCYDIGVKAKFIFRANNIANAALFIGFANGHGVFCTGADATRYWGMSFDTGVPDANFQAICTNAGAVTKTSTGLALNNGWNTLVLEVTSTGANVTLNGTTVALGAANFPTGSLGYILIEGTARAAAAISCDVDLIGYAYPVTR